MGLGVQALMCTSRVYGYVLGTWEFYRYGLGLTGV